MFYRVFTVVIWAMAVRIIACSHFLPSRLIVSSWLSQKPLPLKNVLRTWWLSLVAGWVTVASGVTFWPRFPEEQHILDSRAFYMHSPCCGGCGNVALLPSMMWGAKWMKADCPWEAALWSTCSQNAGNISSSTSVSITFILSFLLISFWGRIRILSPLCPLIRSKEELAGARVISEDLSARDLRSSCMKQTCVKEEACFLKVWRDGCWWDALCLYFKGYLRIRGPLRGVHSCSSLYCMSALPIGFSCLLSEPTAWISGWIPHRSTHGLQGRPRDSSLGASSHGRHLPVGALETLLCNGAQKFSRSVTLSQMNWPERLSVTGTHRVQVKAGASHGLQIQWKQSLSLPKTNFASQCSHHRAYYSCLIR